MTDHGFRRIDDKIFGILAKSFLNCLCLKKVIVMGTCTMGIDILYFRWSNACLFHGQFHSFGGTVLCRGCDMISIACSTIAHQLCINMGTSCFGML